MDSAWRYHAARSYLFRVGIWCLVLAWNGIRLEAGTDHRSGQTYALLINGGGRPQINYQSHLLHVRLLHRLLLETGVSGRQITVFSADGSDPDADLAVREVQPEQDFWLLSGTRLERPLRTRVEFENSEIHRVPLRPATQRSLRSWFQNSGKLLRPGDTLLFYVTDHGTKDKTDPLNNKITLWGKDEHLTVRELRELLAELDPGVRVVSLMSQCYSGAFADLMYARPGEDLPRGNIAGFFSSTADRPAYGCYPENRDKDNVGHSFRFIEALRTAESFAEAHARILVSDRTPDVPFKTSDLYLNRILKTHAKRHNEKFDVLVDDLLRRAWRDKASWEPEIRLLDRMGAAFGFFSPRFLSELGEQPLLLAQLGEDLDSYQTAWGAALESLNRETLRRFLADSPAWDPRLSKSSLDALNAAGRRELTGRLLADLGEYARNTNGTQGRMELLRGRAEATREAGYRMKVRQGVVLRMRHMLVSIAGRVWLRQEGTLAERQAYENLVRTEEFALKQPGNVSGLPVASNPFPSYEEDLRLAEEALPGWMGIRFRQVSEERRRRFRYEAGAVSVNGVYTDSPAHDAGLEQGDIILGPPGREFTEPEQIREWIMRAPIGEPQSLLVQRGQQRLIVSLTPRPYPRKWPELPGPPQVGDNAPPLRNLQSFRGSLPDELRSGGPYLLFFWATWCGPCKAALPELAAFERQRDVPVIAITDELTERLDAFFGGYGGPFPQRVAMDEFRHSFVAYGVSGTPSFVLIDAGGRVESISTGYRRSEGLGIEGWSWTGQTQGSESE